MTHIAIDMDEVIVDFVGGLLGSINLEFGTELTEADITEWDMGKVLDPIIGYSWWKWLKARSWLWAQYQPVPGALGGIDKLHHAGHRLEIVTSKPKWARYTVWTWMGRYRPAVDGVTIVDVGQSKRESTDARILIDDNWDNCMDWTEHGTNDGWAYLLDKPWNSGQRHMGINRVSNWDDILKEVL